VASAAEEPTVAPAAPQPALLVSEVFPPRIGGSGRWFWELYRRLPPDEVVVVAGHAPGDDAFDRSQRLRVQRQALSFPSLGLLSVAGWRRYRAAARALRRRADAVDAGALHCGRVLPEGWLALACARPFACYAHGEELSSNASSRELRWMARRVFRRAALVIANSRHTAGLLAADWGVPAARLAVLSPGVDTARFAPAPPDERARAELGWSGRTVVLTVARLQRRKGHDRLIEAMALLRDRHPALLCAIVGDGEERPALEAQAARAGLAAHVRFHGALAEPDLVRAYQQCDLFALPNRTVGGDFEGFGMVLLEAQACGRAVLAGRSGGTAEAVRDGETGVLVDCRRADVLAAAVDRLLTDAAWRARLGTAGRQWMATHFDWNALLPAARQLLARVPRR
jgi:phosphatidylinositol alpha-1,6-mannosyltransferase